MGGEKIVLLLAAVILSVESCTPSYPPPPREVILSQRYGLVALEAVILDGGDAGEGWEWVLFRFEPHPRYYRLITLEQLGKSLIKQLEGRGWSVACTSFNALPMFGGPYFVIRVRRLWEGAGILLKPMAENTYRLEIGPARPDPRLFDCRHRED